MCPQESRGGEYWNGTGGKVQQVLITRNNSIRSSFQGAPDKLVIRGISYYKGLAGWNRHDFELPNDLLGNQEFDFRFDKFELGICQDPYVLVYNLLRAQRLDAPAFPQRDKLAGNTTEKQSGDHDIALNNHPFHSERAHRTASVTELSESPSFRILSRILSRSVS